MSQPYYVYAHPTRGKFGFFKPSGGDEPVRTALVREDGLVVLEEVSTLRFSALLQEKVRAGFRSTPQPKYLLTRVEGGCLRGEFVATHPDLQVGEAAGRLVFFVALPRDTDVPELLEGLRTQLEGSPIDAPAVRDQWLRHAASVTSYLPVVAPDPCAVLAVAQWAHEERLSLIPQMVQALPEGPPSAKRYAWRELLLADASRDTVDAAFTHLGWPLHDAFAPATPVSETTTDAAEDWFIQSQQCSF